jgi:hypothetical protein
MKFKEAYCENCSIVLARYNTRYFTDSTIDALVNQRHHSHIRQGHMIVTRYNNDGLLESF